MKASAIKDKILVPEERNIPSLQPDEVLIKIAAAGVNRADILQRKGLYPPPPGVTDIPGLEVAGTIAEVGPQVTVWKKGDAVCALLAGGGYAEYVVVPAGQCLPVPKNLPLVQAAALPEAVFTVWTNVFERGQLKAGESLLVHGGSGGIGSFAILMAKAAGATVFATAGSDEKIEFCRHLGADGVVNYRNEDFVAKIQEWTNDRGVDVVLDMVGGDYVSRNLEALAEEGRHVTIAFPRGAQATVSLDKIMRRRLMLTGSTLRSRSVGEKIRLAGQVHQHVWPWIIQGKVLPHIDKIFPLDQAMAAHEHMEKGDHKGKMVLIVSE